MGTDTWSGSRRVALYQEGLYEPDVHKGDKIRCIWQFTEGKYGRCWQDVGNFTINACHNAQGRVWHEILLWGAVTMHT
jgi:hypothetical protein